MPLTQHCNWWAPEPEPPVHGHGIGQDHRFASGKPVPLRRARQLAIATSIPHAIKAPPIQTCVLSPGNFDAQFFRKALPDSSGKRSWTRRAPSLAASRTVTGPEWPLPHPARSGQKARIPQEPRFRAKRHAAGRVPDHPERKQEDPRRNRGQPDQSYIDNAMNLLAAAAMLTTSEMAFVISHISGARPEMS